MKRKRHSEEQITGALQLAKTGTPVAEVIRKLGISEQTFYRWKRKHGRLGVIQMRRIKQLEQENLKLERLVVNLSHANQMLKELTQEKLTSPAKRRQAANQAMEMFGVSERRACRILSQNRSTQRYRPLKQQD